MYPNANHFLCIHFVRAILQLELIEIASTKQMRRNACQKIPRYSVFVSLSEMGIHSLLSRKHLSLRVQFFSVFLEIHAAICWSHSVASIIIA